jgi:hypothetical protein
MIRLPQPVIRRDSSDDASHYLLRDGVDASIEPRDKRSDG